MVEDFDIDALIELVSTDGEYFDNIAIQALSDLS